MRQIWKQIKKKKTKHIQRNERMEKFRKKKKIRKMQISSYSAVTLVLSLLLQYTYLAMSCIYENNKTVVRLVEVLSLY